MIQAACDSKLRLVMRSSMDSCRRNWVAIERAIVYHARARIKCRHCTQHQIYRYALPLSNASFFDQFVTHANTGTTHNATVHDQLRELKVLYGASKRPKEHILRVFLTSLIAAVPPITFICSYILHLYTCILCHCINIWCTFSIANKSYLGTPYS